MLLNDLAHPKCIQVGEQSYLSWGFFNRRLYDAEQVVSKALAQFYIAPRGIPRLVASRRSANLLYERKKRC